MKTKLYATLLVAAGLACTSLNAQNTFPSTGRVGIGTTSPNVSSLLEIKSTSKGLLIPRMTMAQRDAIGTPANGLLIYQTDNNPGFFYYAGSAWTGIQQKGKTWSVTGNQGTTPGTNYLGTSDAKDLVIKTNAAERLRVTSAGRVGIGTTAPAAPLHVIGSSTVTLSGGGYAVSGNLSSYNIALDGYNIQGRYNGGVGYLYLNYYGGYTYLGSGGSLYINNAGNLTAYHQTGINGSYSSSYALNVNANSSVSGIQVTDPVNNYSLYSIKSGSGSGIFMENSSSSNSSPAIYGYNLGGGWGVYGYCSSYIGVEGSSGSSNGVYGYNGGGAAGVYGYSTGGSGSSGVTGYCAGIGYGMSAYGTSGSGIYATSTSNYAGYFSGNIYVTGTYQGSDQKLKQNIKDVTSALDIINQLHPKTYDYRTDGNYKLMNLPSGTHYGLIAQDVEKVLPNLVKESQFQTGMATPPAANTGKPGEAAPAAQKPVASETIDFKAVNYTELIPLLIKGMQEQQKEIDALKQQLASVNGNNNSSVNSATLSSAALMQNVPNPSKNATTIRYNLPGQYSSAKIIITDNSGKVLKQINVSGSGKGSVNVNASSLAAGTYNYSLWVDEKLIDTKQMMLTK